MSDINWSIIPEGKWSEWRTTVKWESFDEQTLVPYRCHLWFKANPATEPGVSSASFDRSRLLEKTGTSGTEVQPRVRVDERCQW